MKFGYAVLELGLYEQTDKLTNGDVFDDNQLCVATMVDPLFKLSPFDSADRRRRALEAAVWAMETTTLSLNESVTAEPTIDAPSDVALQKYTKSLSMWSKLDTALTQRSFEYTSSRQDSLRCELEG